jgi:hypothetical protein
MRRFVGIGQRSGDLAKSAPDPIGEDAEDLGMNLFVRSQ